MLPLFSLFIILPSAAEEPNIQYDLAWIRTKEIDSKTCIASYDILSTYDETLSYVEKGIVYLTTDKGKTWEYKDCFFGEFVDAIYHKGEWIMYRELLRAGVLSTILQSKDGQNWIELSDDVALEKSAWWWKSSAIMPSTCPYRDS